MISETQASELSALLTDGAKQLDITLSSDQQLTLINYLKLLHKWNQAFNLTAVREPKAMLIRHILDSLSVAPFIKGDRAIDVGSGAGLPGMVLAIINPSVQWVLLDSNGKKTRFLLQAASELALTNITVEQARVESYQPEIKFDTVISRAFSHLDDFVGKSNHLLTENGLIVAMKGADPKEELTTMTSHGKVHPLKVPYLNEQRHVVLLKGN